MHMQKKHTDTINHMMEFFVPYDSYYHKQIRLSADAPINTLDDKEFTHQEISSILEETNLKKLPGDDGITSAIFLRVFNQLPKCVTQFTPPT